MSETLTHYSDRLQRLAEQELRPLVMRELQRGALFGEGLAKENLSTQLAVRTGNLRRSVQGGSEDRDGPVLFIRAGGGTRDVRYAAIQEHGGTVLPKRGRFLAIPVNGALTASGVAKKGPRDYGKQLHFVRSRNGGLLVRTTGKGKRARSEVYFLLVRSVRVRGVGYLRAAFAVTRERTIDSLKARVAEALGGA